MIVLTKDEIEKLEDRADSYRVISSTIYRLLGQIQIYQQALLTIRDGDSISAALVAKLALESRWVKLDYNSSSGRDLYRCVHCGQISYSLEEICRAGCKDGS